MLRSRNRRRWLATFLASAAWPAVAQTRRERSIRFGTTPVFLDDQLRLLGQWAAYLSRSMNADVRFVQRGTYREITSLLLREELDAAWICGFPYVVNKSKFDLCALPIYQGKPLYRSHLIVPDSDRTTTVVTDLRDKVFAFSDPQSNSGYLVSAAELVKAGLTPDRIFKRYFFTFGHRKVVEAVASGLAQGGAVDGYVWDTLKIQQPEVAKGVRVAWQSPLFGFPPIVTRRSLDVELAGGLSNALLSMEGSPDGVALLRHLNLDRFAMAPESVFEGIEANVRLTGLG